MNRKTIVRAVTCAFFLSLSITSTSGQVRSGGEIVGLIDARTVEVATPTGRVTVELQHIETPESEQPLHATVKDHLKKLLFGKKVEFHLSRIMSGRAVGQLSLDGVDISRQMLRDGAAWHVPRSVTGQSETEFELYAESERLAKQEKRGVWSVANMEPAWQFRAKAKQQQSASDQPAPYSSAPRPETRRKGYWSDRNPNLKDPGAMTYGFNAATQTGFLGTSLLGVKDAEGQPAGQMTAIDLTYFYTENGKKGRTGYFVMTLLSSADNWRFLGSNTLTLEVDGKNVVIGQPKRQTHKSADKLSEKLTYRVDVATVEKIANGGSVVLKIGKYGLFPRGTQLQMILYNMLQAAK